MLVTAAVDEIQLRRPLSLAADITVHGQVVWTGRSALDIRMQLFQVVGRHGVMQLVLHHSYGACVHACMHVHVCVWVWVCACRCGCVCACVCGWKGGGVRGRAGL